MLSFARSIIRAPILRPCNIMLVRPCNTILMRPPMAAAAMPIYIRRDTHIKMDLQPPKPSRPCEGYEDKNLRLGRVLSPYLSAYGMEINTIFSISHRISGFMLSCYTFLYGLVGVFSPWTAAQHVEWMEAQQFPPLFWIFFKTIIALPLCYHYCNGIRHLIWDTGAMLTMKEIALTSYAIGALALILAFLLVTWEPYKEPEPEPEPEPDPKKKGKKKPPPAQAAEPGKPGKPGDKKQAGAAEKPEEKKK